MEKRFLDLFVLEAQRQANFGLLAFEGRQDALSERDMDRIWFSAQGFLVAAANVSKLLWPSRDCSNRRGEDLRMALSIPKDSPLKRKAVPHR